MNFWLAIRFLKKQTMDPKLERLLDFLKFWAELDSTLVTLSGDGFYLIRLTCRTLLAEDFIDFEQLEETINRINLN